jgi:DNA-binding LacI/PurR family transcriptional regulator
LTATLGADWLTASDLFGGCVGGQVSTVDGRAATIYDVARRAGVSKSTASRVLTGQRSVSPEAIERVRRAAVELGYVRNPAALSMSTGNGTRVVIGVVSPRATLVVDEYLARVVATAARVCATERIGVGLEPLALNGQDPLATLAVDPTVHGILLVNTTESVLRAVDDHRFAGRVVSIGVGSSLVPAIDVDNYVGAHAIMCRLVESGRRRIAMVTGPRWMPCLDRMSQAYDQVMSAAGLPKRTVVGGFTADSGQVAANAIVRRWPDVDAIFAVCDATALGVIAELRAQHIDVPTDVAVAGFDDTELARYAGLTTATHPVEAIAEAATRAVLDARATRPPDMYFPSHLVARQTA